MSSCSSEPYSSISLLKIKKKKKKIKKIYIYIYVCVCVYNLQLSSFNDLKKSKGVGFIRV